VYRKSRDDNLTLAKRVKVFPYFRILFEVETS